MASKLMVSRQQAQDFLDFASMVHEATRTVTDYYHNSTLVPAIVKHLKNEVKRSPTYRQFSKEADLTFEDIAESMVRNYMLGFNHNKGDKEVNHWLEQMLYHVDDLDEDEFIDTLTELNNMA